MVDDQLTKSPSNICATIAQQAASIISDVMSGYWSTSENQPMPRVFISQAQERVEMIAKLLTVLADKNNEAKKKLAK